MADDIPTVRWGSKGATVALLQTTLNAFQAGRRDALVADGIFGKLTYAAVRTFQRDNGLEVDGIVGPKTWGKLAAHGKIDPAVYGPKPAPPAAAPAKAAEEAPAGPTIAKAPPLSYTGFAEQQTQDDCGYFASYALAKCTEKKSLEIRFTKEDVLTERNIFVDREDYRQAYLTSNRVPDFMAQLGTSGYKDVPTGAQLGKTSDLASAGKYLLARIGQAGVAIACWNYGGNVNMGHWIAVLAKDKYDGVDQFFVYDSSCYMSQWYYDSAAKRSTVCWVDWRYLMATLQGSGVTSVISKY